jgi:hypothetical protein
MMFYPLAEVGIGVFMPIVVGSRQLVMDILRHSKRRNGEQEQDKADCHSALKGRCRMEARRVIKGELTNIGVCNLSNNGFTEVTQAFSSRRRPL